jgi:2-isopropylmalate synthase/UPF0716 protein FxsA
MIYLFLEVLVSVNISSAIGGLSTFFEILLSAFVGISLLVNFRTTLMQNLSAMSINAIDVNEFQRLNLFTIIGAFLLIIPGFLTDIIGILMQFSVFTSMIVNRYGVKSKKHNTYNTYDSYENIQNTNIKDDCDVIDVEIIEHNSSSK